LLDFDVNCESKITAMRLLFTALASFLSLTLTAQESFIPKGATANYGKLQIEVTEVVFSDNETFVNLRIQNKGYTKLSLQYHRPGHRKAYKLYSNGRQIAHLTKINRSGSLALSGNQTFNLKLYFTPVNDIPSEFSLIEKFGVGMTTYHNVFDMKIYRSTVNRISEVLSNVETSEDIMITVSPAQNRIKDIAVFGRESKLCDGSIDDGISLGEVIEMGLLGIYNVVERRYLNQILEEQKLAMSGLILEDSELAVAGCLAGAQGTVIASYGCIQDKRKILVKLIDCSSSELLWSAVGLDVSEFDLVKAIRVKLEE